MSQDSEVSVEIEVLVEDGLVCVETMEEVRREVLKL